MTSKKNEIKYFYIYRKSGKLFSLMKHSLRSAYKHAIADLTRTKNIKPEGITYGKEFVVTKDRINIYYSKVKIIRHWMAENYI